MDLIHMDHPQRLQYISTLDSFEECKELCENALGEMIWDKWAMSFDGEFTIYNCLQNESTNSLWYRALFRLFQLSESHQQYMYVYQQTQKLWWERSGYAKHPEGICSAVRSVVRLKKRSYRRSRKIIYHQCTCARTAEQFTALESTMECGEQQRYVRKMAMHTLSDEERQLFASYLRKSYRYPHEGRML